MITKFALSLATLCACLLGFPALLAAEPILFEDFESADYAKKWRVHWNKPVGTATGTVSEPPEHVFRGKRSAYLLSREGEHKSLGRGEYVPEPPVDDLAYMRLYLRLDDRFDMGTANQLKLFAVRGGATIEDSYGGAGKRPTGLDKFSVRVALNAERVLHLYTYHAEQKKRYGDHFYCKGLGCGAKLDPGRWYCLELMFKNNTPGENDGEMRLWKDDKSVVHVEHLRFRDTDKLKMRRFSIENYFGGGGKKNTSPRDQRLFVDDFVISQERIGCKKPGAGHE
jgi:hypothetical protein